VSRLLHDRAAGSGRPARRRRAIRSLRNLLCLSPALLACLPLLAAPSPAPAQVLHLGGMASTWANVGLEKGSHPVTGLRFIPELSLSVKAGHGWTLDADVSANGYGTADIPSNDAVSFHGKVKPYRAWLRLATSQFEARVGLQKIDFGSATLLRPLMWFDTVDPRDLLQVTDGVTGLLLRYYTVHNVNLWLWGLYGNTDPRGWDVIPTVRRSPEFGGRFQVPLFKGELAVSYHHRRADIDGFTPVVGPAPAPPAPEDRVGLDGKWDLGVGVWFEGTLVRQRTTLLPAPWRHALNVGLDYTFGLGRGLTVLTEYFVLENAATAWASGPGAKLSAFLARYPLGVMDELRGIAYYDWRNRTFYRFADWQHTTDRWTFSLMAFWNPAQFQIYPGQAGNSLFRGKGFQLQLVYNF
jgi:hypothetical protein